jgi:signal transduction histidine kinase
MTTARRQGTWSKLARPAAVAMGVVALAAVVLDLVVVLTFPAAIPSSDATRVSSLASALPLIPLGVIATVLALRRPTNPAGWLLGSLLLLGLFSDLGSDYMLHWLYGHDLPQAPVTPLALVSMSAGPPSFFPLTTLLLVFPDGHLLSKRWRVMVWLNVVLAALAALPPLFDPNSLGDGHRQVSNPLGVAGAHQLLTGVTNVAELATFATGVVGLVSLGMRYRRADTDVRQQIKWFGVGVVVLLIAVTVGGIASPTGQWTTPVPVIAEVIGFSAVPLCIGVAVLKYRLYDIDLVISRTLAYGSLAALITAVYVGIAVGIGTLVGSGGKPNLALSILATAIVAVGFQPVRERVQKVANRLVYGKRATPYEVLSEFSEQVAETHAADEVLPRMARVLQEGAGAESATVWLYSGGYLRPATTFPESSTVHEALLMRDGAAPEIPDAAATVPVEHQGVVLGAFSVTKRKGESLTPTEGKLIGDLALQAGLVLRNVGLTAELRQRLDDLRSSRQRLVHAQDEERRRIERNLHDGAQQHLVAIKVKIGLAQMLVAKAPEQAKATVTALKADADEALEALRDLARGIYPPLLADKGLVVALESQARKLSVPVTVDADGVQRYTQEVEASVYFCVLEALQNVQKYASASHVVVRLSGDEGMLTFEVEDDGAGFDVTTTRKGAGLTNMSDRIDAIGGSVEIRSHRGAGTTVHGALPVETRVPAAV